MVCSTADAPFHRGGKNMDARNLMAAVVVGCAVTACALDVAPDAGDSNTAVSGAAIPVNTGAEPDPNTGTPCDAMLGLDDTGNLVVTGYLCPQIDARHPDPEAVPPGEPPEEFERGVSVVSPR
jgi:hypothetical protein